MTDADQRLEETMDLEQNKPKLEYQEDEETEKQKKRHKLEEWAAKNKIRIDLMISGLSSDSEDDDEERMTAIMKHNEQVSASGGFEVDYFPQLRGLSLFLPVTHPETDERLRDLSEYAITGYNEKNRTNYELSKVLNGTYYVAGVFCYYLTFQAKKLDGEEKTFRAKVCEEIPPPFTKELLSCEIHSYDSLTGTATSSEERATSSEKEKVEVE